MKSGSAVSAQSVLPPNTVVASSMPALALVKNATATAPTTIMAMAIHKPPASSTSSRSARKRLISPRFTRQASLWYSEGRRYEGVRPRSTSTRSSRNARLISAMPSVMPASGSHLGRGIWPMVNSWKRQESIVVSPVAQANQADTAVATTRQVISSARRSARGNVLEKQRHADVRAAAQREGEAEEGARGHRHAREIVGDGTCVPIRRAPICTTTSAAISTMKNAASTPLAA